MENDESNTPAEAGTDPVETTETDTPFDYNYYDPDEDTVDVADTTGTEPGADNPATDDPQSEAESTASEKADRYVLSDGTEVGLDELKAGHLRQADYTRKTQELAQTRQALDANATRISNITQAFVDHLSSLIPGEPSPALAMTNPGQYTAQKAQYDAAIAQVQKLVEIGSQAKSITGALTTEQRQNIIQAENAKMMQAVPETRTAEGRQKFFNGAMTTAKSLGFTEQEIGSITDHRLFVVLDLAAKGLAAKQAQATAKAKVQNVPPATPKQKPGQTTAPDVRQKIAVQKFAKSRSLRDAMAVDFD